MGNGRKMGDRGERFCYAGKGSPRGELAPVRATERGLQFLHLIVITPLRLDKLGTSPQGEAFYRLRLCYVAYFTNNSDGMWSRERPNYRLRYMLRKAPLGGSWRPCTSQQILDTNHKKIYNKKLSVSQISVRNATCDIELASDSLTNKLDAVH